MPRDVTICHRNKGNSVSLKPVALQVFTRQKPCGDSGRVYTKNCVAIRCMAQAQPVEMSCTQRHRFGAVIACIRYKCNWLLAGGNVSITFCRSHPLSLSHSSTSAAKSQVHR